jgi:hypothetical protein
MPTSYESTKGLFVNNSLPECLNEMSMWESVNEGYQHNTMTKEPYISKEIAILREAMEAFDQKN